MGSYIRVLHLNALALHSVSFLTYHRKLETQQDKRDVKIQVAK